MAKATCSVYRCEEMALCLGWCAGHYQRWKRKGDVNPGLPLRKRTRKPSKECSIEGCSHKATVRCLCPAHYQRWRHTGSTQADVPIHLHLHDPEDRFIRFVDVKGPDECWLWTGLLTPFGYGDLGPVTKNRRVHRYAYVRAHGGIPEGLTIDHLCHGRAEDCQGGVSCLHRRCCNPAHLEAVTLAENIRRSGLHGWAAVNKQKTHCAKRGHPLTGANLGIAASSGSRFCRECARESQRYRYSEVRP